MFKLFKINLYKLSQFSFWYPLQLRGITHNVKLNPFRQNNITKLSKKIT